VPVNGEKSVLEGPEGKAMVKAKTTVVIYRKAALP
jgi:hypothetical protein